MGASQLGTQLAAAPHTFCIPKLTFGTCKLNIHPLLKQFQELQTPHTREDNEKDISTKKLLKKIIELMDGGKRSRSKKYIYYVNVKKE